MTYHLGSTSLARLEGVHPNLVRVVKAAILISTQDFSVLEGVRSDEQARINYGKGRTVAEVVAKGLDPKYAKPALDKVTWLNHPLMTNHRRFPDGYGHAVDLVTYPIDWESTKKWDCILAAMKLAALRAGVKIRAGADWNGNGIAHEHGETDLGHFELA